MTESMSISPAAVTDVTRAVDGDGDRGLGRHAVPQRGRHAGHVHRQGADARSTRRASPARSSSPTTAAPTARSEIAERSGARVVPVAERGLRQRAHGRDRRGARPLRHHGRRRRQLRLPRARRSSSTSCARATSSCRAAGCQRGGGTVMPGRHAVPAPLARQPAVLARWRAAWFRAPIHDVYCGMRGFTKRATTSARPALHGHGVRDGDDHQGEPPVGARSPRCRSRCIPTGARRTRRTCGRSATAGARCASS